MSRPSHNFKISPKEESLFKGHRFCRSCKHCTAGSGDGKAIVVSIQYLFISGARRPYSIDNRHRVKPDNTRSGGYPMTCEEGFLFRKISLTQHISGVVLV